MYISNGPNYKQFDLIKSFDKNPTSNFMELGEKITLFMKVTGCLLVSSLRSAGPILFSFTIKLVGAGKTILGEGSSPPPLMENQKEIIPRKQVFFLLFLYKIRCKQGSILHLLAPLLKSYSFRDVAHSNNNYDCFWSFSLTTIRINVRH